MADRNLVIAHRGGIYTTREGMELHVPPSGFDFRTAIGPSNNIDPYLEDSITQRYPLGTKLVYGTRIFRYCLAGAANLAAGDVQQSHAAVAGHVDETVSAAVKGATTIDFTPSATAITVNEYRDGFLSILSGTGQGYAYQILSHPLTAGTTLMTVTLIDPIAVTLAATPKGTLHQSPWGEVIQAVVTTRTGMAVGVAQCVITAAQFGWIQTRGPAAVALVGTSIQGDPLVSPTATTAGSAGPRTTALVVKETVIGHALEVSTNNGDTIQAFLTID